MANSERYVDRGKPFTINDPPKEEPKSNPARECVKEYWLFLAAGASAVTIVPAFIKAFTNL